MTNAKLRLIATCMAKKKTEKTDTPETEVNADTASAAEQLIIDVTPERVASGKGASYAALILALFGVGLGGFATYHALKSVQGFAPAYPSEAEQLDAQLIEVEDRIDSEIDAIHTQFDALHERLDDVESRIEGGSYSLSENRDVENLALESELNALKEQVAQLEAALNAVKTNDTTSNKQAELSLEEAETLLITLRYQRVIDRLTEARTKNAQAMRNALKEAAGLKGDAALQEAISKFTPHIATFYTLETLKTNFAAAADEALAIRVEGEGWWQQQVNQIAKLVKVRKIDADEDSIAGTIARAQTSLDRDQVGEAVLNVQYLSAPASSYFAQWLPKAAAYEHAASAYEQLLSALRNGAPKTEASASIDEQPASAPANNPDASQTTERTVAPLDQAPALAEE